MRNETALKFIKKLKETVDRVEKLEKEVEELKNNKESGECYLYSQGYSNKFESKEFE